MNRLIHHVLAIILSKNNTGQVARNTLYLTISEIVLKVLGIAWIVFLAHMFSVAEYGKYNLVTSFIAIFSFLPDFGIGLIVIREIAKNTKNSSVYLGNAFFINGFLSLVTFLIIVGVAYGFSINVNVSGLIFIAAATLILSTLRSVAIFYFDGREKMQYSAFLNTLNSILLIAFATMGVLLGFGLMGVFGGMLLGTFISLVVSWGVLLRFIKPKFVVNPKIIRFYLLSGAPLAIASLASLIFMRVDILILGFLLGGEAVGVYSSATPFAFALIQLLNVPFVVSVYPALSRIQKEDAVRFERGIVKSLGVIAMWSIPAAIIIAIASNILIPLIFGNKYDAGIPVLRVLILFVPFLSLSAFLYKILIILDKQKDYLIISVLGAVLNISLNFLLIPYYGLLGAAWSAVITQVLLFIIYSLDVFRALRK